MYIKYINYAGFKTAVLLGNYIPHDNMHNLLTDPRQDNDVVFVGLRPRNKMITSIEDSQAYTYIMIHAEHVRYTSDHAYLEANIEEDGVIVPRELVHNIIELSNMAKSPKPPQRKEKTFSDRMKKIVREI